MQTIQEILQHKLKGATRIAILGVGSNIMGDDIAGMLVAQNIENKIKEKAEATGKPIDNIKVLFGGTAPENITGDIKKFNPTHIIIIDSADFRKEPGFIGVIELDKIGGMSFCTHRLPLKVLADYLTKSLKCQIMLLAIQPKAMLFGDGV